MAVERTIRGELELACRLADALIESATCDALALVEELARPTAVFVVGDRTPHVANAAWRALAAPAGSFDACIDEAVATRSVIHVPELRLDRERPCYLTVTLRPSRGSARTHVTVACIDITDEVIARQLGLDATTLVWSGPLHGEADYANRGQPITSWHQAIHVDDLPACTKALAAAVASRGTTELEARLRVADAYRWHRVRFRILGARWFGCASDIHAEHEARAALDELRGRLAEAMAEAEHASRLKDQFLAVVLHELRAPLTTIVLWEGVLRDETAAPALREKALAAIHQSTLSQSRVVGDLLDVSRAVAGKLHIDVRPVEIGRVVRDAIESFAPAALEKHIVLEHRDDAPNTEVEGDVVRLRQVFDNLLSNALKFTEIGGHIQVTVRRRGRTVTIEITDTGQGIAPEQMPTLFDPFRQWENVTTRRAGGLGLGLAIVQQLVGLHGGTIVASSPGVGQGTTMAVTFRTTSSRRRSTPPMAVSRTHDLGRTRVLVVDDDHRMLDVLGVLLQRAGAVVDTADSAAAARAQIANTPTDIILCDIAMPGEDGYSFIRGVRAERNPVAAIALTAYATPVDIERALAAGFDRHLAKPIDFERLVENIHALAPRRDATRETT